MSAAQPAPSPPDPGSPLAVVVPVRDDEAALERLLASLRRVAPADLRLDVVVVDDASRRDPTPTCARHGARCLRLGEPAGPARARNEGARATSAPTLLFLDADVLCPPGLFEAARDHLAADPEALALSFLVEPWTAGAGTVANFGAALEHHWLRWYLRGGAAPAPIPGVTTRSVFVRRSGFDAIGGFDPAFRTNAIEDFDFGKRLAAAGRCLLAPAPRVPHAFPARFGRVLRNYWVRASLFAGHWLRVRPPLDPVQVAPGEAALRLAGAAAWPLALLAAATGSAWAAAAAALLVAGYLGRLRPFLVDARRWSGSTRFALAAAALHFASSPVIVAGAAWGVLRFLVTLRAPRRRAPPAPAPARSRA